MKILIVTIIIIAQVSSCDSILARMENLLLSFQSDLGSISTEILRCVLLLDSSASNVMPIFSLQQQSVEMNLRLKNRQAVRKNAVLDCAAKQNFQSDNDDIYHQVRGELSQFVDDLVVTEQLISTILETPVSEQLFLEQLQVHM